MKIQVGGDGDEEVGTVVQANPVSSHGDLVSTPSEAQLKMEELAIEREKLDLKRDHESNKKFFVSIEVGGSMCAALISLAGVLYLAGVFDGYVGAPA